MLPEIDVALLARMNLPARSLADGESIFVEGDLAGEMFIVHAGEVLIEHRGKTLDRLAVGDVFGEMALIDGAPRSATARASGPCEVLVLNERNFIYLVDEMPYFALKVMRVLAHRLRVMNDRV